VPQAAAPSMPLSFYLDDGLDFTATYFTGQDLIFPSELADISKYYQDGNYRLAVLKLRQIDSLNVPDGNQDAVLVMLGECYRKLGLGSLSVQCYNEINHDYTLSPLRVFALYRLQDHFYRSGDFSQSDSLGFLFEKEYKNHRLFSASTYLKAKSLFRENNYKSALHVLGQIPKESDYFLSGVFLSGLCEMGQGNNAKALAFFDYVASVSEEGPLRDEARLVEGDLYYRQGRFETALDMYNRILGERKANDYLIMQKANLYVDQKNFRSATTLAEDMIRNNPKSEYIFEAGLLLERCYNETAQKEKALWIKGYVSLYARESQLLFVISGEVHRLSELTTAWTQLLIQTSDPRIKRAQEIRSLANSELKKIRVLRKKLQRLAQTIDPSGLRSSLSDQVGFAEQRYLELLNHELSVFGADSSKLSAELDLIKTSMESSPDSSETDSLKKATEPLQKQFRQMNDHLLKLRGDLQIVIKEYFTTEKHDRHSEELQAKFVDWGLIRNQEIKAKIQEENKALNKEIEKLKEWMKALKVKN
jgi:tetratricopeptide (TPR) repeat protein